MKTESIVGNAIFAGTVGMALLYTWHSFDPKGNDIAGIYLNAMLLFGVPGYSLILLNHYLNRRRRPPSRFLVGVALFLVTLLSWLAINESVRYSIIVELPALGLLIFSFLLMKPELECQMLGGTTQDMDREECENERK